MSEIVLKDGESAQIVILHSDASLSTVKVAVDDTGHFKLMIDSQPGIPYGLIHRVTDPERPWAAELHIIGGEETQ